MDISSDIKTLQERIALYEDMNAYKALYELLYPRLHRFSVAIVKSPETAEEIVSDVFIKLWELRRKLGEIQRLGVYLYTVTKNLSLNYITRRSETPLANLDLDDVSTVVELRGPLEQFISAETIAEIRRAINDLPPRARIIFQLTREDGMKYKEVAAVLGISVLTVRNQLALAIKRLAQALPDHVPVTHLPHIFSKS